MKYSFTIAIPLFLILTACSIFQKKEPIKNDEVYGYVPIPDKAMAKRTGTSEKDLHVGFGVYVRSCGQCHIHMLPDEVSNNDWHIILPGMAWNAGINSEEERALLKFLIAAKTDPNYPPDTLPKLKMN